MGVVVCEVFVRVYDVKKLFVLGVYEWKNMFWLMFILFLEFYVLVWLRNKLVYDLEVKWIGD